MGTVHLLAPRELAAPPTTGAPALRRLKDRVVTIRYTGFSPRTHGTTLTMFNPTLERAVWELWMNLERHPGELEPLDLQLGNVAVLARMPAKAEAYLKPGTKQPLALVDGLKASEIRIGLADMMRDGWGLWIR